MITKYLKNEGYRAIPLLYGLYLIIGGLIGSSVWSMWFHLHGSVTWTMLATLPALLYILCLTSYAITKGIFQTIDDYIAFRIIEKKRIK